MSSRSRFSGAVVLVVALGAGCDQIQPLGSIPYRESPRIAAELATKPKFRETIQTTLATLYGSDLQHIKVPANSKLRDGGIYLASQTRLGDRLEPTVEHDAASGKDRAVEGGYALYRTHCLHCHGVSGAGDGPTAAFLFPRPRDYRPGIFKFTSTNPTGAKPSRADLRKTLLYGLHGTSMPGFEATMTGSQIDQVIDYVTFLSLRGETERVLIDRAVEEDDKNAAETLAPEAVAEIVEVLSSAWQEAETQVVNPAARRVEPTRESIRRGRDLYLGLNATGPKIECATCHGLNGQGNGLAFIDRTIFDDVVFRQYSFDEAAARSFATQPGESHAVAQPKADSAGVTQFLESNPAILTVLRKDHNLLGDGTTEPQFAYLIKNDMPKVVAAARALLPQLDDPQFRSYLVAKYDLWTRGSLDAWSNPLRPANLIDGVYKGGRRPLDLYWRIAKGINGAKMPAHSNILTDDQIWDVINFVLALPEQPELLQVATTPPDQPKTASRSGAVEHDTR